MRTFLFGLGLCLLITACHKVNQYYNLVDGQPWMYATYPTTYYVGDTMTMTGKMFIGKGGVLQVGAVQPSFLSVISSPVGGGTGPGDSAQTVSFLITKEMGIGKNIPVSLTVNGITVQTPAITILQLSGVLGRTDTTLWVDQITSWQPTNLSDYQNQNIPLIIGSSVSSNGNIYFDNPLGVFSVIGGAVQPVLSVRSVLSDKNGPFTVNKVLGSAISFDGNTLAFSAAVSDNSDTVNNYVFRLCTMDIGSKTITTLNRTLELRGIPSQAGSPGPYTGPAANLNLVAAAIQTDVNGNWYFSNIYAVPYTGYDMGSWYSTVTDNPSRGGQNELDNICELGVNGNIKSLFRMNFPQPAQIFTAPGYPIVEINSTLISQDGSTAYIHSSLDQILYFFNVADYSLNDQALLSAPSALANYKFISYDTSAATGVASSFVQYGLNYYIYPGQPDQMLALPNGYVLINNGLSSLYAFNVLNQTMFCYAGTEQGIFDGAPAIQNQAAGAAKYVNFALNGNSTYFNGIDATGTIYYFTAPASYGSPVFSGPLTFYKLYSKK
jgi:hypothetical protein